MTAVTPVTLTTPDGVERLLRFTLGARKRISGKFGTSDLRAILNEHDAGALPDILWCLMHDAEGKPPEVSVAWLAENIAVTDQAEVLAAIVSAASQGKAPKNELEALITASLTGSTFGPTVLSASDSPTTKSGTDTSNAKSAPESIDTGSSSESGASSPD